MEKAGQAITCGNCGSVSIGRLRYLPHYLIPVFGIFIFMLLLTLCIYVILPIIFCRYCIEVIVDDGCQTSTFIIFDEAGQTLLKTTASNLASKNVRMLITLTISYFYTPTFSFKIECRWKRPLWRDCTPTDPQYNWKRFLFLHQSSILQFHC